LRCGADSTGRRGSGLPNRWRYLNSYPGISKTGQFPCGR
jgi:hypothetical protein